jgi:hypothetical protein|tara:strand:- start:310 stop:951 length:642 start_codon:yes stop_codon:yes gene_type:complete
MLLINKDYMNADFRFTEVPLKKNLKAYIYDNCLPVDVFKGIQKTLLGLDFPWYYNEGALYNQDTQYDPVASPIKNYQNNLNVYQFTHSFFREGDYAWSSSTHVIVPILNVLEPRAWIRVKANLGPREPKPLVGGWHYDSYYNNNKPYDDTITGVLHINTNNGYTLLETGDKIESVENRLVLLPCNTLHTGITQTDTKVRVLLNFNFFNKRKLK